MLPLLNFLFMLKRVVTIILFLSVAILKCCNCQDRNSNWCFGDSAGINFNNLSNPTTFSASLVSRGTCASISDSSGNLLFYTNTRAGIPVLKTTLVWSKNHQIMLNGDSIIGRGWYKEHIIVPYPGANNLYYLFTAGVSSTSGFFYSIIDMSQNGGLGTVVQKNVQLQGSDFWANDGISAIKHGNGRDWWVVLRNWYNQIPNDTFYFYLITPAGVSLDHIQNIGDMIIPGFYRIEPANDGNKIAVCTPGGLLEEFTFDRCTGYLSSEIIIEHENPNSNLIPWYWDCELSANKNLLYVSSTYSQNDSNSYLFQYNLNDANPSITRDTLYRIKEPVEGGLIELAPDNKIYWSCDYYVGSIFYPDSVRNIYNENLSVINYPDSLGATCDFQPFSFYLGGKRTYYGLPNNPNYELGADSGSICDSLTVGILNNEQGISNTELFVFYHPGWQTAFINAKGLAGKKYVLTVADVFGHIIYRENGKLDGPYYTYDLHMNSFADGLYIVSLVTDKEVLSGKFIRQ